MNAIEQEGTIIEFDTRDYLVEFDNEFGSELGSDRVWWIPCHDLVDVDFVFKIAPKEIKESEDFDWITDTPIHGEQMAYKFNPPLSVREYKKVLIMLERSDDSLKWHDGSTPAAKIGDLSWLDKIMFRLKGGVHSISIDGNNTIYMSWNPTPELIPTEEGGFYYDSSPGKDDNHRIHLDPDNPDDVETIDSIRYRQVDGREFFGINK